MLLKKRIVCATINIDTKGGDSYLCRSGSKEVIVNKATFVMRRTAHQREQEIVKIRRITAGSVVLILLGLMLVLSGCATLSEDELYAEKDACEAELNIPEVRALVNTCIEKGDTRALCEARTPRPDSDVCWEAIWARDDARARRESRRSGCCIENGQRKSGCTCMSIDQFKDWMRGWPDY